MELLSFKLCNVKEDLFEGYMSLFFFLNISRLSLEKKHLFSWHIQNTKSKLHIQRI